MDGTVCPASARAGSTEGSSSELGQDPSTGAGIFYLSSAELAAPQPGGQGSAENGPCDCAGKCQLCLERAPGQNCPTLSWPAQPRPAALGPAVGSPQLGDSRAGKRTVLTLPESHGFLSSHCTDKTKAALKWMPGLAGCQRQAGDKGWEHKRSAGSGEPRMLCGTESASPWRQDWERTGMGWGGMG